MSETTAALEPGRLALGVAPLGNLYRPVTEEAAEATLEAAWDAGIRYFDTAPHYGLGLSERRLGKFLSTRPRGEFLISTKVGRILEPVRGEVTGTDIANLFDVPSAYNRVVDYSEAGIRRSIEDSLERTGLDRLDIVYLHDPDEYPEELGGLPAALESGVPAVLKLREEGLVGQVGIGTKSTDAAAGAMRLGDIDLVMLSGRYTLLEQPAAEELLPLCIENGVGVVAVSVFNSGLLATPTPRADAHYDYGAVPPQVFERAMELARICEAHGVELPAAALQYPLRHPAIRSVLVGSATAEQVRQNALRADAPIPERLWGELAEKGLAP